MLLTISNLYPCPHELRRGLFNAQLFDAVSCQIKQSKNICLVPEWRIWMHKDISGWADSYSDKLETKYSPYLYMPVIGRNYSWKSCWNSLEKYGKLFDQCDAILATWLYPDCVAAVELAKKYNKKIWLKVHGTDRFHLQNSVRGKLILNASEYAEGIICNAQFMKNELVKLGMAEEKLHIIQNGVDGSLFKWRDKKAAVNALCENGYTGIIKDITDSNAEVVLLVGNLVKIKGIDILLNAWKDLLNDNTGVARRLIVIGNGRERKELEAQAEQFGISDSVCFLGSCAHKDVALWMNVADILCLSSRSEGMPNVVFEALVSGLPVVATDVGDCKVVLGNDSAARVVPVEDSKALASGILDLLKVDIDRAELARSREERFSWDKCAEEHLALITE